MTFFVRPLKYANFHREHYLTCATLCNDFTWPPAFLSTKYFVLSSKLNPLSLLKLAKKNFFFGEYFWPTYFSMSKSSIKTKTVLAMTDMTESTELQSFKRQKDGYKVTVKVSFCICVVLSWNELEVRQNLPNSDYEIHMVCLLVATVNWHKSQQMVKKSNKTLLPCLLMILLAVPIIILRLGITFWYEPEFCVVFSPPLFIS